MRGWDWFLTILVVVLAFLSASFLARNSDLWFHLATGRLLAQGEFSLGADPFAYTTRDVYWACHSWLFDLGLYDLYNLVGSTGLVVLKALVVATLAGVLVRVRRPGSTAYVPVTCMALALVAMSPRLLLQPACASYFLLGLTFWLLWKPHAEAVGGRTAHRFLPLLFVLWVNVDEWFLLGPGLAALFWLGERLQGQKRTPGWVAPAGLAACLLNPYTYHAFTLPSELSTVPWASGLREDVRFQAIFASPWSSAHLLATRPDPVALAYFALTLLGVLSFLVNWRALWGWRMVVWLPFAGLAAWHGRAIPFFAIVAAPITALNWQDFLSSQANRENFRSLGRFRKFAGLCPLILAPALVGLMFLTWTGWRVGSGGDGRHVAWGFQAEPSAQRATEMLHEWRRKGLLYPGERVFAVSPDIAQYGAWFCRGEEQFLDHRYPLFADVARDYETVCRSLVPGLVPSQFRKQGSGSEPSKDWRQVLRDHHVAIVVFSDRDPQRLFSVLQRVAKDPEEWTLLDVSGQALIVGWNKARPSGFSPLAFDADRLAFDHQDEQSVHSLPAAPDQGPLPTQSDYWTRLVHAPAPPSWQSAAATMYLHFAGDNEARQGEREKQLAMCRYAASLAGLPALPPAIPQAVFQLVSSRAVLFPPDNAGSFLVREQLGPFFASLVERSPALPLLAVRAARQAVAANPEDSNAWLRLGQAYLELRNYTCERSAEGLLPPLAQLRYDQIVTALEQAVRLDPDLEKAHHELAYLYGEHNYLDLALEHRREEVRLSRRAGPLLGETADETADRLELLEKDTAKLVELVKDRRKKYASASRTQLGGRLAEAGLALNLGLGRQALEEILMQTPADVLGAAGMQLELDLLLSMGRAQEVRTTLSDEKFRGSKQGLLYYELLPPRRADGSPLYIVPYHWPAYEWLHALQAAALGDYASAREDVRAIRAGLRVGHEQLKQQLHDSERLLGVYLSGLLSGPPPFLQAYTVQALATLQAGEPTLRGQLADLSVLEGMLDLEQGDTDAARSAFAEAQDLCTEPLGPVVTFAGGPIAARYLGKMQVRD